VNRDFDFLLDALKSLPGIGNKQAKNIAYFLINKDEKFISDLVERIKNIKNNLYFCEECNNISIDKRCKICNNPLRNDKKICIVNTTEDLNKIEETKSFDGLYYVLNNEIDAKKNTSLNSKIINKLVVMINKYKFKEIIIATNWTINGEATAAFIKKMLNEILPTASIYRLAIGLPINSALDYADNTTLKSAIENKTKY
jgi:recombination protein RecR